MCYYRGIEKAAYDGKRIEEDHIVAQREKKKPGMLSNIILIVALAVFCFQPFNL